MTSISQLPVPPPHVPSTVSQVAAAPLHPTSSISGTTSPQAAVPAASGRAYPSGNKKPFSSAPSANSAGSLPLGGGASSHTKSESFSPLNGKGAIPPAVPSLSTPNIINGNNAAVSVNVGHSDHSRKASVTITPTGTTGHMPNGGPVGGKPASGSGIQFGQITAGISPVILHSTPPSSQSANSLAVAPPSNPRILSPQTSPTPIPQPQASGGRPPSSLHGQGNGLSFGSHPGDDTSRPLRPLMPSGSLTPGMQPAHLRRESSQSTHSEMSNSGMGPHAVRGGYPPQGNRGRGYGPGPGPGPGPGSYPQSIPSYSANPHFRSAPNQPRGGQNMGQPYPPQRPLNSPYQQPPHQPARSPALTHSQPLHPQQGQMPIPSPGMSLPYYAAPLAPSQNQFMAQGADPGYAFYNYSAMHHPMPYLPPPVSPRPSFNNAAVHAQYMQSPYQQSQSMSRSQSGVSERPVSNVGLPQTPITPAATQPVALNRGANSPGPKSANFQIPAKKNSAITIKNPNSGQLLHFEKPPISPAPPSKSPANVSSTPTPPPRTPSHTDQHRRTDSKIAKTIEEKKHDMKDLVAKKIEADKEEEKRQKDEAEAKALQEKEEAEATAQQAQRDKDAKAAQEAEAEAQAKADALAKAKQDAEAEEEAEKARKAKEEEEYFARMEAEIEAEEALKEKEEQEREQRYQKKKAAEKEEQARKMVEAAARAEEDMKKAEREADAAEAARLKDSKRDERDERDKAELFKALKKDEGAFQAAASPVAVETPVDSGTVTPVSESASMGPPPRVVGGGKKVLTALKIETSKPIEAPQPSAALQSLRSARFLTAIDAATYPAAIASPNPALNTAAPMGKFRYDKTFLMQFQTVFIEKPSETWTDKVKETVGDPSETPASARGSSSRNATMMPSRQQPNRASIIPNAPGSSFAFSNFPGNPGGRNLPTGTAPDSRFANPQGSKGSTLRYNPSGTSQFSMGFPQGMSRSASSTSLGHPSSPRSNPSHRGTGGRGSKGGKPQPGNNKDAQKPLPPDTDLTLKRSATGWKTFEDGQNAAGMAGPPPGGDGYLAPDIVQRKVKAALNKMTPSTFDKISNQILEIVSQSKKEMDGRTLRQVIQLTFEKATDEAHWAQMYAEFCSRMLQNMTADIKDETLPLDKNNNVTSGGTLFRKYLLNRCQQDFEAGWKAKLPEKPEGESEAAAMLSDEYYVAAAAKRRGLGLVRFIGELFKLGMLTSRIMHMCVHRLVDWDPMPDEATVESLHSLLKTIGDNLDSEEKMRPTMDAYFDRIKAAINADGLPSRLKFMLMDIVDLRKKGWKTKDSATKGPTTLEEVRAQAAAAEREKEAQRAADSGSRRGGGGGGGSGGGRMGLGRGDARNFSGGGQFMPPPNFDKNTVGMDDIRRLKGGSRQASSQGPMQFGPTSLFNARGSNTRKTFGPGGALGRGGEESGASSRTATPQNQRERKEREEKETATSANAFSALAALDSGETTDHPASPPSVTSSPPVAKSKPMAEQRQQSKSPLHGPTKTDNATGGA